MASPKHEFTDLEASGSSISSPGTGGQPPSSELTKRVFSIALIWEIISEYLHVGDLKCLRGASKWLRNQITESLNFKERIMLTFPNLGFFETDFTAFVNPVNEFLDKFPEWPHISIRISGSYERAVPLLTYKKLKLLKVTTLRMHFGTSNDGMVAIYEFLTSLSAVKALEIENDLLVYYDLSSESEKFTTVWKNVTDLNIFSRKCEETDSKYNDPSIFSTNLQFLRDTLTKLKKIAIGPFRFKNRSQDFANIIPLLEKHQESLKSLHFRNGYIWELSKLSDITFPSLKRVSIKTNESYLGEAWHGPIEIDQNGSVKKFLEKQPALAEISIEMVSSMYEEVIAAIATKSEKLTKLQITVPDLDQRRADNPLAFLTSLNHFTELSLTICKGKYDTNSKFGYLDGGQILESLPLSIKKISLKGLSFNTDVPPFRRTFPNLSELTLIIRHPNTASCSAMMESMDQLLLENDQFPYVKLQTLQLNIDLSPGCFGVLKNIQKCKGLRVLTLRNANLGPDYIKYIKFPELKSLDITNSAMLTQKDYQIIINQNPSLETLMTSEQLVQQQRRLVKIENPKGGQHNSDAESISSYDAPPESPRNPGYWNDDYDEDDYRHENCSPYCDAFDDGGNCQSCGNYVFSKDRHGQGS